MKIFIQLQSHLELFRRKLYNTWKNFIIWTNFGAERFKVFTSFSRKYAARIRENIFHLDATIIVNAFFVWSNTISCSPARFILDNGISNIIKRHVI